MAIDELTLSKSGLLTMFDSIGLGELLGQASAVSSAANMGVTDEWVEVPDYACLYVSLSLNFVGDTCLRTNLVTKQALAAVKCGNIIEIITDNLSSIETIHFMSPNYNCTHLVTYRDTQWSKIYVQKDAAGIAVDTGGEAE